MSKKEGMLLTILISVIAIAASGLIKEDFGESFSLVALLAVMAPLLLLVDSMFSRHPSWRSRCLYYLSITFASTMGFMAFTQFSPYSKLSPWWVKIVVSLVASLSIVLSFIALEKISGISIIPWEREKRCRQ
ncbi:MAG: hypothetical protein RBT47_04935 [Anaerolineae bacterium]|jgi:hypothetical protein|nr:hypothetical protein [Anaerolineae bacterium]